MHAAAADLMLLPTGNLRPMPPNLIGFPFLVSTGQKRPPLIGCTKSRHRSARGRVGSSWFAPHPPANHLSHHRFPPTVLEPPVLTSRQVPGSLPSRAGLLSIKVECPSPHRLLLNLTSEFSTEPLLV